MTAALFVALALAGLAIEWLIRRGLRWIFGRDTPLIRDILAGAALYILTLWSMDWMDWFGAAMWGLLFFCLSGFFRELQSKGVIGGG